VKTAGFLFTWLLILAVFAAAAYGIAADGDLLAGKMLYHAPPEATGLPEAEYPGVGRMTAAYLTGRAETFQYTFRDGEGRERLCFRDYEADHMADCRGLISLAGILRWVLGGAALLLAAAGMFRRRAFAGGVLAGLAAAGVLCLGLLLWGLTDFGSLFTAFHRLAFTNEGWLLDPRTDLLIRLMPTSFFVDLALRVFAWMTAAALAVAVIAGLIRKREKAKA